MTQLTQVAKREGRIARVPRGETPVVELSLAPNQSVVSIDLDKVDPYSSSSLERKTVDWRWTAYIATNLGGPDE